MSYTHLTISERSKIETYLELGYSIRSISKKINRSPSTISRELRYAVIQIVRQRKRKYATKLINRTVAPS